MWGGLKENSGGVRELNTPNSRKRTKDDNKSDRLGDWIWRPNFSTSTIFRLHSWVQWLTGVSLLVIVQFSCCNIHEQMVSRISARKSQLRTPSYAIVVLCLTTPKGQFTRYTIVAYDCSSWRMLWCLSGQCPKTIPPTNVAIGPKDSSELITYITMSNGIRQSYCYSNCISPWNSQTFRSAKIFETNGQFQNENLILFLTSSTYLLIWTAINGEQNS